MDLERIITGVFNELNGWVGVWPAILLIWLVPPACWWLFIWWWGHPVAAWVTLGGLLVVWGVILLIYTADDITSH